MQVRILRIYVSTYLRTYVSMYLCIYVSMYLCIYVSMYLCMYVCISAIATNRPPRALVRQQGGFAFAGDTAEDH